MKDNLNDPNNHVPAISPDDDWDDLDAISEKSGVGLPPRRTESRLPAKKETRGSSVTRHNKKAEPSKDDAENYDEEPVEKIPVAGKSAKKATPKKAAKKTAKKTAKKSPKEKVDKPSDKKAKKQQKKQPQETAAIESPDATVTTLDETTKKLVLPSGSDGRPTRVVNKIGTGDSAASDARPHMRLNVSKTIAKSELSTESAEEQNARMRNRFVRGERGDWGAEVKGGSTKWMVYTGFGVVLLVVVTVVLSQIGGKAPVRESDLSMFSQLELQEKDAAEQSEDLDKLALFTNSQDEAKEIFAKYATAGSIAEISDIILDPETLLPLLEKRWQPIGAKAGWSPDDSTLWTVLENGGDRYGLLEGTLPDFNRFTAFFQKQGDGLKIDWKASNGYSSAEFSELKAGKGDASEVRTTVSRSDFYTFSVPEEKFHCYRLMSPDGEINIWGYAEIGGELDGKIAKLFIPSEITGESQSQANVLLSLAPAPEGSLPNQWIITEFLGLTWLDQNTK